MYKKSKLFLVSLTLVCLAVVGSHAQVTDKDPTAEAARLQSVITKAVDTAVYENGQIRSLRITLPNDRERLLTFEHTDDQRSLIINDEGRKTRVVFDDLRRISEVVFPDGKKAKYEWVKAPTGYWVPAAIKVDGKELRPRYNIVDGQCSEVCERAAQLTVLALGTCVATGPLSSACWAATAGAAIATYWCYRCIEMTEEPPEN